MSTHFADRLIEAIKEKNAPACVGLDPLIERLPPDLLSEAGIVPNPKGHPEGKVDPGSAAEALLSYGRKVIRVVAEYVPAIKINIAFFERYGAKGVEVYFQLVELARQAGLIVIGDVKRADIGHSTTQYAHAQLGGSGSADGAMPDAVTVNPYFGYDAIRPFVEIARATGRGIFVLVQTSNESAAEVQGLSLPDGSTLCQAVATLVQTWSNGEGLIGESGYSCIGAVVSPRDLASTERIRALMPNCIFLVPGFGAQGRTAGEVAKCFDSDGSGAVVTASRSVIYAYQEPKYRDLCGDNWRGCIEHGCKDFVKAIRGVLPA